MQKFCQEVHLTSNTIAFCLQLLTFRLLPQHRIPTYFPDSYCAGTKILDRAFVHK